MATAAILCRGLFPSAPTGAAAALKAEISGTRQNDGSTNKFIYVLAQGGWDPTRVLADGFDHPIVAIEPGSERARIGDLSFVDHPDRPSVRAFFEQYASRCLIVNGVQVPSIDHRIATNAVSASMGSELRPQSGWPHQHATFADHVRGAVAALDSDAVQSVSLVADSGTTGWDTHSENDAGQSPLWERLFSDLGGLVQAVQGASSGTLADRTTIVVCSEMGRTPTLNRFGGKDHWPYTSMLLVRSGYSASGTTGGWDQNWYGIPAGR